MPLKSDAFEAVISVQQHVLNLSSYLESGIQEGSWAESEL